MNTAEQLHLYKKENNPEIKKPEKEYIIPFDAERIRKLAIETSEERKRKGRPSPSLMSSSRIASIIIEHNTTQGQKIDLSDPQAWEELTDKLETLEFIIDRKEVSDYIKELRENKKKRELQLKRKMSEKREWGIDKSLPTGDRE